LFSNNRLQLASPDLDFVGHRIRRGKIHILLYFIVPIFQKCKSTGNFYTKFVFDLFKLDSGKVR